MDERSRVLDGSNARRVGWALVAVGLGWLALSRGFVLVEDRLASLLWTAPFLYADVSVHVFDTTAVGVVTLLAGLVVVGRERLDRSPPITFAVAVGSGAVAVAVVAAVVVVDRYWGGPMPVSAWEDVLDGPPVYVAYYVAGLFATSVASTRRQRYLGVAGVAALPAAGGAFLGLLIARNAGWFTLVGIHVFSLTVAALVASFVYAVPLCIAGRALAE